MADKVYIEGEQFDLFKKIYSESKNPVERVVQGDYDVLIPVGGEFQVALDCTNAVRVGVGVRVVGDQGKLLIYENIKTNNEVDGTSVGERLLQEVNHVQNETFQTAFNFQPSAEKIILRFKNESSLPLTLRYYRYTLYRR